MNPALGRGRSAGRAGRAARSAAPAFVGDEPPGGDDRDTPSPDPKLASHVLQKSPITSPEDSPQDSPKAPGSPTEKMASLLIADKGPLERVPKTYGAEGVECSVSVNYIKVVCERQPAHIYHVTFTPPIDSIKVRRIIMQHPNVIAKIGDVQAFTGMNLYLPHTLKDKRIEIVVPSEHTDAGAVQVVVEYVKVAPWEELVPFFNTLLRRAMRELRLVQIKRQYFDPTERIQVPVHKLEIWPGMCSNIAEYDGGLFMCCDISHRILRTSTVLEMLRDIYNRDRSNFQTLAKRVLVGCVVLTRYNNMPYRIDDVDFNSNPRSTFPRYDGTTISYLDYFRQQWDQTITDHGQPMLVHMPKLRKGETETRQIVLVPELCFMTGLTDDIRSDTRAMRDIAAHTRIRPEVREAKLTAYIKNLNKNPAARKIFADWNISLQEAPLDVKARIFNQEQIKFGKGKMITVPSNVSWNREALQGVLYQTHQLNKWSVIVTKKDEQRAFQIVKMLQDVAKFMGFEISMPGKVSIENDSPIAYVNAIRAAVTTASDLQMLLVLTPGAAQREDRYNAVKKLLCCELGIPSQVLRIATISDERKARSVAQKVALQMQCKIGGQPWVVNIPFKAAMFVGIDVYHDPNRRAKSCVAMVSSTNPECSRWFSKVFFQGSNEEIVQTLKNGLVQAVKKFTEVVGNPPDRIFVYRDGVGDGQIPVVKEAEVPQMIAGIEECTRNSSVTPKLTCIVVQKRIDTRILFKTPNGLDNPHPGTVLDRVVTRINFNDFFLVSQHVTQGTVTPTHYVIAHDAMQMPFDKLQRLTYRMTFLYYNWTGAVRVPAPCQYAHKMAYLAGQNLASVPKESICDRLFFL